MSTDHHGLRVLASALGVQLRYADAEHQTRASPPDAVAAVLAALLGRDLRDPSSEAATLERERHERLIEPVGVVWRPGASAVPVRTPATTIECRLEDEDGRDRGWTAATGDLARAPDGQGVMLGLPEIEPGYYRLHVEARGRKASCMVICAPWRAYRDETRPRDWAVFLPLYALRSERSWGQGDFSGLRELSRWVASAGGGGVSTLPLLAQFYDEKVFEPSPYSPASRLMWNEAFIDAGRVPESTYDVRSPRLPDSPGFKLAIEALRTDSLVDWEGLALAKRQVLSLYAQTQLSPQRSLSFAGFKRAHPEVSLYARFRAQTERHGPWQSWPQATPDFDAAVQHYHEYVQWVADAQVAEVAAGEGGLNLDLPLGVNGAGFDTWRWPESFVRGLSAGAPPDPFFRGGQDWGFRAPHPLSNREQAYEYVIAYIRHNMRYAGRLRIDHVMGLHRLFVIPDGFEARDGVYVRYPAEELYAIFCLESHRNRTEIVGENLGTVPRFVTRTMRRHGFAGMYVLPFEIDVMAGRLRTPRASDVASLNTHDLPPFAAWWSGEDIAGRERIGQLSEADAIDQRASRHAEKDTMLRFLLDRGLLGGQEADSPQDVCRALLRFLGESPARLVLANLEDFWGETDPQNVPGTTSEHPNWRRKARLNFEEMRSSPDVVGALAELDRARRKAPRQG